MGDYIFLRCILMKKNPIERADKILSAMKHREGRGSRLFVRAALLGMLAPFVLTTAAWAQNVAAQEPEQGGAQVEKPTLRTLEDMQALEAAHPAVPVVMPPDLPTMDFQQYRDLKEAAPAPGEMKPESLGLPAAPPILGPLHCVGLGE